MRRGCGGNREDAVAAKMNARNERKAKCGVKKVWAARRTPE